MTLTPHDPTRRLTSDPGPSRRSFSEAREFGGPWGAAAIMLGSHAVLYYLWAANRFYGGAVWGPGGLGEIPAFLSTFAGHVLSDALPNAEAAGVYLGFLVAHAAFSAALPGLRIQGLPLAHEGGRRLDYVINGHWAWYLTLGAVGAAHLTGLYPLQRLYDNFGPLMTVAVLSGNAIAILTYVGAHAAGRTHRMDGNHVYDFFMGAWLNPRIGRLDLKMWAEVRMAWCLLFLLTCSAAAHQYDAYGTVSAPMIFMVTAHFLYANACHKGEECIPTTWDIFHEKWGWMLIFWNLAGVPFVYCFNAMYLAGRAPFEHPWWYTAGCFALLLGCYYVWDTSQSQRNRFRMQLNGSYVERRAPPQLPWGTLEDPEHLDTEAGSKLLVDGWWRYARKIHYTADVGMALSWGLICGSERYLPYFYVTFFVGMILHRASRDIARCEEKYGADWDRYKAKVPWLFVPFVF